MNLGKFLCPIFLLLCKACIDCKQHRVTFPNEGERQLTKPLSILHFDVYFKDIFIFYFVPLEPLLTCASLLFMKLELTTMSHP